MACARLFAMPAVISVSTISSSGGFEPDHHVGDVAVGGFSALVVQGHDDAAPAVAAGIFEPDPEVLDLRPPPGQLVPELLESRAVDGLEFLDCLAGFGPSSAPSGGFGEDQGGQQLSRLDVRVVVVRWPLDPAHRPPSGSSVLTWSSISRLMRSCAAWSIVGLLQLRQ